MPLTITSYRIFLASPGDVKDERNIVKDVVDDFNNTFSEELNAVLKLIRWETHTYPSFGEDAQSVINEQIKDEYDIFIGILWRRFGSPTLKYNSGTEEEFYRAFQKYTNSPSDIRIMIYFNDEALPISSIDIHQLSKINDFKIKLQDSGGYYFTYNSLDNFKSLLRSHLYKVIKEWSLGKDISPKRTTELVKMDEEVYSEELGYWDFDDLIETKFAECSQYLEEISTATTCVAEQIQRKADELTFESQNITSYSKQRIKTITAETAKYMNQYSTKIDSPIKNWIISYEQGIKAMEGLLHISNEFIDTDKIDDLYSSKNVLEEMLVALVGYHTSMSDYCTVLKSMPRMSQLLIIAQRQLLAKTTTLLKDIEKAQSLAQNIVNLVNQKIWELEGQTVISLDENISLFQANEG